MSKPEDPKNALRRKRPPPPLNARPLPPQSSDGRKKPLAGSLAQRPPPVAPKMQPGRTNPGKFTLPKVVSAADEANDPEKNTDGVEHTGYGRPPKQHRFKMGEVNNPYGRRGKSRASDEETLLEVILAELGQSITVTEGSKSKRMRKMRALAKKIISGALKGEAQATRHLISLLSNQALRSAVGGPPQPQERELTMADEDIIEQFRQRCSEEHKPGRSPK
jgi:hypothetical protein